MRRASWLVALVLVAAGLIPGGAKADSVRTIKCVSARYSMQVLKSWVVQHGCSKEMTLASPDGNIGMDVKNTKWSLPWSTAIAKTFAKEFFADQPSGTTVIQALRVSSDVIAGRTFVEAEQAVDDGSEQDIEGLLVGFNRGRVYTFFSLIKVTGNNATDDRNSLLAGTMWRTVRLF